MTRDDFSAARDRVLARQSAREAAATSRLNAQRALIAESPISRLPFPLNRAASPLHKFCHTIQGTEGTRPAFRVGQVDAELLDEELLELLRGQVGDALKYFEPHLREEWSNEILLALRAALWKLSVWDHDASYGASLQGLRFADARSRTAVLARPSRWQKAAYGTLTVLGRYGWQKWEDWLVEQEGGYDGVTETVRTLGSWTRRVSTAHSIAAFLSFCVFLVNGRYRTLTDRLLRMRLVSPSSQVSREVSFEYLNRQLVWHAFTEFLLFLLPLVGISRWRRWLSRVWKKAKNSIRSSTQNPNEEEVAEKSGLLAFLPERTCAICYQDQNPSSTSDAEVLGSSGSGGVVGSATTDIVNPYETMPCSCIYCFVCIATKLDSEDGEGWTCLKCGETVTRCRAWNGDVLVESRRPASSDGKTVGFVDHQVSGKDDEMTHLDPKPEEETDDTILSESNQWSSVEREDDTEDITQASEDSGVK